MYTEKFPAGSSVLIADRHALEHFRDTWKLHNPLHPEQLAFAGAQTTIASVGSITVGTCSIFSMVYPAFGTNHV
jgi:hypothetical protein